MKRLNWDGIAGLPDVPVIIGENAIEKANDLMKELELTGAGFAIYDDDAYRCIQNKPRVFRNLLYDNEQLYCDQQALDFLFYTEQKANEADYFVAIGGEEIQSIVSMLAAMRKLPYIAIPTSAFGTGISSGLASFSGKKGLYRKEGRLPCAVIADTRLMASADDSIATGAVHELIDRTELLARGRAIALACNYPWNEEAEKMQNEAINNALRSFNVGLRLKSPEAYEALAEALILCGLCESKGKIPSQIPARLNYLNERIHSSLPSKEKE